MKKRIHLFCFIFFIFNVTAIGQITFQKTFGGQYADYGYFVEQTIDGGYIVSGVTNSFGAGGNEVYLIKTDANGDSLWTKTFGGMGFDFSYCVRQTTDGGYILTGTTQSFGAGLEDVYLIKTDGNGDTLWTKTFGGANNSDYGWSVQQTMDGGYIITGYTFSFGAGQDDVYLIKTDTNGNLVWSKTFGSADYELGFSVQQTIDGGYIITGDVVSPAGNFDVYLIKTDSIGDTLWTKSFGGIHSDVGYSVKQTVDGGYIIAGNSIISAGIDSDIFLIKTDVNGDTLWTKSFGGTCYDQAYSVQETTDGGYIVLGLTCSFGGIYHDVYLIKTDSNGDTLWTKIIGSASSEDYGSSIQQTSDGGYIIAGYSNSFGTGGTNVYLIKTDSDGNSGCNEGSTSTIVTAFVSQVAIPLTIVTSPTSIVTTPATIVSSGGIFSTLCTTVGIKEIALDNSFRISPNPVAGNFIISFEEVIMKGSVEILNSLGTKVFIENISTEYKKEINLKNISQGIYFVKVFDGEKYYCKKLIVEHD